MRSALSLAGCALFGVTIWAATPQQGAPVPGARVEVPPPPFSDGIFPCSQLPQHGHAAEPHAAELSDMHTTSC